MAFVVRYRRHARERLNACAAQIGPTFLAAVEAWLQELADEAEQKSDSRSSDAKEFLNRHSGNAEGIVPKTGLDRWLAEGIGEKISAVLVLLLKRCPPWEFRMAMEVFLIPNTVSEIPSSSPAVASAFYEVDRVEQRIVVTIFPDLPYTPAAANSP